MALTAAQRLEAELSLTAAALGMTGTQFSDRVKLWDKLAAEREGATAAQQQAHVKALALHAWIARLMGQADKFRAEGDVTVERDLMGRIRFLEPQLTAAQAAAGLTAVSAPGGRASANPAPLLEGWGIG